MAEQAGSFAGFQSGVPSTGGQGQGLAQVFTPQAIGLDTTSVQRAGAAIGELAQKKAAKPKVDLELMRKMQEARSGIYNLNNEVRDRMIDDFREKVAQGENPDVAMGDTLAQLDNLTNTETKILQPLIKDITAINEDGTRTEIYDDEGKYVPADKAVEFLTSSLQDSPEAQEALKNGTYNQWVQNKAVEIKNRSLKYNPNFSLGNEVLNAFKQWGSTVGASDKTDVAAAFEELNSGANLATVFESRPDLEEGFMEYMQTRTDILPKWVSNYAIQNGMSPYTLKTGEGEFMGLAMDAMMEEVANVSLPKPAVTKRMSVSPKSEGSGGETVKSMFSTPAKDTAPIGRNKDELSTRSVTIQTEEPFPIKVGSSREYAQSRKVHYDEQNNKYYLEYVPYKDVETGTTVAIEGLKIEELGGSKYKPDYQDVRFVQIDENDPNFESLVSTIAKTSKAERGDISSRIIGLKDVQEERQADSKGGALIEGFSDEDVRKAAKESNMTVAEYIKMYNEQSK